MVSSSWVLAPSKGHFRAERMKCPQVYQKTTIWHIVAVVGEEVQEYEVDRGQGRRGYSVEVACVDSSVDVFEDRRLGGGKSSAVTVRPSMRPMAGRT